MDRSDNSQPPADVPPTEKTQPTAPAPATGQKEPAAEPPVAPSEGDAAVAGAPDDVASADAMPAAVPEQTGGDEEAPSESGAAPSGTEATADTAAQAGNEDATQPAVPAQIDGAEDAATESGAASVSTGAAEDAAAQSGCEGVAQFDEPPAAQPLAQHAAQPANPSYAPPFEPAPTPGPVQEQRPEPEPSVPSPLPHAADAPAWAHGHPHPLTHSLDTQRLKDIGVRAAKVAAIVFCAWFTVALLLIAVYRFVNPPASALMVLRFLSGNSIERQWVPLEKISPNLALAVITSEDDRFCEHWGVDYDAIAAALKRSSKGTPRGASTITMQVAKNMFLWPAKSYVRKVLEVPLTYAIELVWPKWRILEIYLNIAEWGPGIFGAEAAAQAHFGRPARQLSSHQAALLAVSLPNPHVRNAGRPGGWTSRRATVIQRRAARNRSAADCVLEGR